MRHRTTVTSVLVTAAVVLVLFGAAPGAAAAEPSLSEIMQQHDLAVFEWHRLSQVNTVVTDQRLSALPGDGFTTVYADISEYVEVADQRPAEPSRPASPSTTASSSASWTAPGVSASRCTRSPATPP